ncbi:MAG: hypothetical protein R2715_22125 [Ilumatobacteraceae bacterium]
MILTISDYLADGIAPGGAYSVQLMEDRGVIDDHEDTDESDVPYDVPVLVLASGDDISRRYDDDGDLLPIEISSPTTWSARASTCSPRVPTTVPVTRGAPRPTTSRSSTGSRRCSSPTERGPEQR